MCVFVTHVIIMRFQRPSRTSSFPQLSARGSSRKKYIWNIITAVQIYYIYQLCQGGKVGDSKLSSWLRGCGQKEESEMFLFRSRAARYATIGVGSRHRG